MASVAARRSGCAPEVNCFDLVELMPGARPSANPAQRFEFEERCKALHRRQKEEEGAAAWGPAAPAGEASLAASLEAMFPAVEPDLIRTMLELLPSEQMVLETLLFQSAAFLEADAYPGGSESSTAPGADDHDAFPTLVDAGGWQAVAPVRLDQAADLGSAWRDRAWAAAAEAAAKGRGPPRGRSPAAPPRRTRHRGEQEGEDEDDAPLPTDDELRHGRFQQRARRQAQHGRRGGPSAPGGEAARRSDPGPRAELPRSRDSRSTRASSSTRASPEQKFDPRPRADQPRAAACFSALRCKEASDLESTTSESSSLVC